jgi:hypothetical protein
VKIESCGGQQISDCLHGVENLARLVAR